MCHGGTPGLLTVPSNQMMPEGVLDIELATGGNLFVTGKPGVGKTTLIERVLSSLGVEAAGFFTREIRERGARVGFSIASLSGAAGVLAHVDLETSYRVGRYGVNRSDLERVGVQAIEDGVRGTPLVVMDELGRMELCSPRFRAAVEHALDSDATVFGTIQDRRNPFLDGIRARPDVTVLRVTECNRYDMADPIVRVLERALAEAAGGAPERT